MNLLSGTTIVDSFTFNAPDDVAAFIGVWSDIAFDNLQIRETFGTDDNEYYGRFYTGATALNTGGSGATSIPEPGALALFSLGLVSLIGNRRKNQRNRARMPLFRLSRRPLHLLSAGFLLCLPLTGFAADELLSADAHALAFMAPANRWAVRLELRRNGWDQQYNDNGEREAFGAEFDQVNLDSSLLPGLAPLGPGATLGSTALDSRIDNNYGELALGYGVTDNLTVGVLIPFARTRTSVNFAVNDGNVGFNPGFDPSRPISGSNYPFAPAGGGIPTVGTEGVQQILTDPAFGYAYTPIEDTSRSGFGDPTIGLLWRFFQRPKQSLVLGLGVRLGIAKPDDPDNLLDFPVGDGSTDLRAQLEYFRDLGANFDLRLLLDRKVQLADRVTVRIPPPGQLLALASSKEEVNRDLGDFWEYDVEVGRSWGDWRGSLTWHRYDKQADRYSSDVGTDTSALEAYTRVYANQWRAAVSWSGIKAWQQGSIPLPLIVRLEMQRTYEGRNFMDVSDLYLRVTTFF